MSETKHMPGPWFIDPEYSLEIRANDGDIAPWVVARAYGHCGYKVDTAPANARLIAAAPDLAAEVERLRDHVRALLTMLDALITESSRSIEYGEEDPFRMGEWFEADELAQIEQARAAIANARVQP